MTSVVSKDAPSHFAALLRRSKFASYDQRIGQVYTAHGGFAHRGDWGLKRPMPNKIRVKRPYISIGAVDSIYEQTEWSRRGPAARWVDGMEEMGMDQATQHGAFGSKTDRPRNTLDSDFARRPDSDPLTLQRPPHEREPSKHVPMLNTERMRPAEFDKYLGRLRELRPQFKEFLVERHAKPTYDEFGTGLGSSSGRTVDPTRLKSADQVVRLTAVQNKPGTYQYPTTVEELKLDIASDAPDSQQLVTGFISQEKSLSAGHDRADWIEQRPHSLGALSYSVTSALQTRLLFPPVKGRLVEQIDTHKHFTATVAGLVAHVEGPAVASHAEMDFGPYSKREDDPTKWTYRDSRRGVARMRLRELDLVRIPRVVDDVPEDLAQGTVIDKVSASGHLSSGVPNPYFPGSQQYLERERPEGHGSGHRQVVRLVQPEIQPKLTKAESRMIRTGINKHLEQFLGPSSGDDGDYEDLK